MKSDFERLVDCLYGESLMGPTDLMNYLQDNGIVSDLCVTIEDCVSTDLARALNHFRAEGRN